MQSDRYRDVMRHQAGAVAVITVGEHGARTGLTATAVCSVSDDPPKLLICVNRSASAHDPISKHRSFCVNILCRDQQDVADVFSGRTGLKGEDRFGTGVWSTLETGAPALNDALATLDCAVEEQIDATTHSIFIARVVEGRFNDAGTPLLYFRGDYWDVARGSKAVSA
jgi:flavin reductase